ncbi:WecB/TagA/CpsF family glycosyltransferase [Congregibacter variabilis]|uniref:WecB/TagA/CpsF family glycosyltransferase n=1 Tax=Congregibacter variabilis TaxID=3081200 RepID=A0ABZ0I056_9GAMM|nr:WecB/TagA/CpsF family glycosyltransferase [Congregibacter sp. IMCC43200]
MSTLTYNPGRDCFNSLGIPVDNLTLDSAVERIIAMASSKDGRARLVSTLNADFLVNCLGTALSRPRHPELLEVLRSSDLVTADGFPIVWLSRLLGRPIKERVCGSDLVPAIAERAAQEGLSIFLLGGASGVAAEAGRVLEACYPGLRIAGTAAPFVKTTGRDLASAVDDDRALLEEIHASKADILLVGLGNPKQELWFNRNRKQLKTPVSIGVGGTFEFVIGTVRRAPAAWQSMNLEWVYRILQDPARLWKRYSKGLFKLSALATPVIMQRIAETFQFGKAELPGSGALPWRRLWSSRDQSIALLPLPRRVGTEYLQRIVEDLAKETDADELRILDFSEVRHIALNAQQELFNLASLLHAQRAKIQLMGMSSQVRRQLTAARLMDLLENDNKGTLDRLSVRPTDLASFACQSYALKDATLVMLSGRINRESLSEVGFVECLLDSVRDRHCIIDFRNVDLLESSGIAELMPLFTHRGPKGSDVFLSGVGHNIKQMLRMAEVDCTAEIINDRQLLERISKESSGV